MGLKSFLITVCTVLPLMFAAQWGLCALVIEWFDLTSVWEVFWATIATCVATGLVAGYLGSKLMKKLYWSEVDRVDGKEGQQ